MNNLPQIQKAVENYFNLPTIQTEREKDNTVVVDAKKIYSLLARNLTNYSFRIIGENIGIDNHTLILYYIKKARGHCEYEKDFQQIYDNCLINLETK